MAESGGDKPTFKSIKKKRPMRARRSSDDEDPTSDSEDKLQELQEIQKLRKRPKGVNVAALASGKKVTKIDEFLNSDPDLLKLKTGGLLTLEKAKKAVLEEETVGTQFSKETRVRDEDEEMRRFIEQEMEKRRRGAGKDDPNATDAAPKYMTPEEAALASLPAHLKRSAGQKSEEMLSSQMLSGIPEVDLGIDEKIRNIEATEAAKKKAAEDRAKKARSGAPSHFVPTNLAVNFKQPNRFKLDEDKASDKAEKLVTQRTVVVGQVPDERLVSVGGANQSESDPTRATDDLHVTKFKKHFQRK